MGREEIFEEGHFSIYLLKVKQQIGGRLFFFPQDLVVCFLGDENIPKVDY